MILITIAIFCIIPIGLITVAYAFKKRALGFLASGFSLVIGGLGFSNFASVGDTYYILGWLGIGMAIVFALLGAAITEPTTGAEDPNPNYSSYARKKQRGEERQRAQAEATKPRGRRLRY